MAKKPQPSEQRVLLSNIGWQQFEDLLSELGVERSTRLSYGRNRLELMTPVEAHDRCARLIDSLILLIADHQKRPISTAAPVLLTQQDLGCATEPDACYWFRSDSSLQDAVRLDLRRQTPPDIAVEVALNKSPLDKLPLYEMMDIPEVWRYITTGGEDMLKGTLQIYSLDDRGYTARSHSLAFPFLPSDRVLEFLEQSDSMGLAPALRVLRSWVEEHTPAG